MEIPWLIPRYVRKGGVQRNDTCITPMAIQGNKAPDLGLGDSTASYPIIVIVRKRRTRGKAGPFAVSASNDKCVDIM